MADKDLTGKIVIVTGVGSGLGRAMSIGLARAGAAVLGVTGFFWLVIPLTVGVLLVLRSEVK